MKEKEWIYAIQGSTAKQIKFKAGGNLIDPYNQSWTVEQDEKVLDLSVNMATHSLNYDQYPDVLKRLSGALRSHQGEFLVVTAKPGYELASSSSPTHKGGGGHGSIRKMESLVPLIISGTDQKPESLRMVDLKAYLLNLLTKKPKEGNRRKEPAAANAILVAAVMNKLPDQLVQGIRSFSRDLVSGILDKNKLTLGQSFF